MMQVGILSQAEAGAILIHPYAPGLYVKMFEFSSAVKEARPTKTFGCRHCPQKAALAEAQHSSALDHSPHRTANLYTFDGLISHMKAKYVKISFITQASFGPLTFLTDTRSSEWEMKTSTECHPPIESKIVTAREFCG